MANATHKYTAEATNKSMKSDVTAASDTTDLGSDVDVAVFVSKTATNKQAILNTLDAVRQKIFEEPAT